MRIDLRDGAANNSVQALPQDPLLFSLDAGGFRDADQLMVPDLRVQRHLLPTHHTDEENEQDHTHFYWHLRRDLRELVS